MELPSNVQFSIGSGSAPVTSRMDLSLDDLIKQRRPLPNAEARQASSPSRRQRRTNPKMNSRKSRPTAQERSIGQSKAKRQADIRARRNEQLESKKQQAKQQSNDKSKTEATPSSKSSKKKKASPTRMEIEKEIDRAQKTTKSGGGATKKGRRKGGKQITEGPTKEAVVAAVRAMKDAGFKPPQGMQVVISFQPKEKPTDKQQQGKAGQPSTGSGKSGNPQGGRKQRSGQRANSRGARGR